MMKLSRRRMVGTGIVLPAMVALAFGDTPLAPAAAQSFIEATGKRVVAILQAASSPPAKAQALYQEVRQSVAIDHVGMAVLGSYRGSVTAPERARYLALFHRAVYFRLAQAISMVRNAPSVSFSVTGVSPHKGGYVVQTAIHQDNAPVVMVGWLVGDFGSGPKISDVLVQGISMLKTVRASYTSVITDHDGNIDSLLAALRRQVHQS
jgi:ABC-type transporter MlaC component